MVWTFDNGLSVKRGNVELLRHYLHNDGQRAELLGDGAVVVAMFESLALRLQAVGNLTLRAWLGWVFRRPKAAGLRYPYLDEQSAIKAGELALHIMDRLLGQRHESTEAFLRMAEELFAVALKQVLAVAPGDGGIKLLIEALARGIPLRRISVSMPLYRLGQGCRQQRLWRGFTSYTSHIGTIAATHKSVANELLRSVGLPVARQRRVGDFASAKQAAAEIGFPVVVKPAATDYGTAVTTGIQNEEDLLLAFSQARQHGAVLVEEQLPGADYRLVVVNGRLTSAIRREPAQVIGDGASDMGALVARLTAKRRSDPEVAPYGSPSLADPLVQETLRRQGLASESIPAPGQVVLLRTNANVSTGGSFVNVTADVHPDNALLAVRAAACLGLDHAGIDLITPDICQPWHLIKCGICEINPTPGMNSFAIGSLLDDLFPSGSDGRIPVVLVVGDASATEVVETLAGWAREAGRTPGTVHGGVARIGGQFACRDTRPTTSLLDFVLADASVGFVVVHITVDEVLQSGLRLSECDLAVFPAGEETYQAVAASAIAPLGRARTTLIAPDPAALSDAVQALLAPLH